jgi:hypothetical protein
MDWLEANGVRLRYDLAGTGAKTLALGSRLNHSHQMTIAARVTAAAKLAASLS